MEINNFFQSPEGSGISAFARIQEVLYQSDTTLQDYFMQLQGTVQGVRSTPARRTAHSWRKSILQGISHISRVRRRPLIKADVLLCPLQYGERKTEDRLFIRTLLGLAETGATILCLLPESATVRQEALLQLTATGRVSQVAFIDPVRPLDAVEAIMRPRLARRRAEATFDKIAQLLAPHGFWPRESVCSAFEHTADFVESWERLAPSLEFSAVVTRCHWHTLCSAVCRTAAERGKPSITFQQGTICHTLDVPVTASHYIAFGDTSADFLGRLNRAFFEATGLEEPSVDYIAAGSLHDSITVLPNSFDQHTLLLLDVPNGQVDFYGIGDQCRALLELADRVLTTTSPLRVVIRPHPFWSNLDFKTCQVLVRKHPGRCELSHPSWSLEDDLRRSSVVAGIFSGALTVAAASGLPSIFLMADDGFAAGDLACFPAFRPEEAFCRIRQWATDRGAYADARVTALRNAREYYARGGNAELSGEFFEKLLQPRRLDRNRIG